MVLEWKDEYSVNVKEIDEQHKVFLKILNNLYVAINNYSIDKELTKILEELVDYTKLHFSTEEKYFEQFNYSHTEEHKEEHKELIEKSSSVPKIAL